MLRARLIGQCDGTVASHEDADRVVRFECWVGCIRRADVPLGSVDTPIDFTRVRGHWLKSLFGRLSGQGEQMSTRLPELGRCTRIYTRSSQSRNGAGLFTHFRP